MKNLILAGLLIPATSFLFAQTADKIINKQEVERIERVLAGDEMRGRRDFTPDLDKAADFIAAEFKKTGLQTWNNSASHLQSFSMITSKFISASGSLDGMPVDEKNIITITTDPSVKIDQNSGYEKVKIKTGSSLFREAMKYLQADKNYIVIVDTSYTRNFRRLAQFNSAVFSAVKTVIFILTDKDPGSYNLEIKHEITESKLANVVGVLPGKSLKDEYVIFSGHYDHLGVTDKPVNGDSIYNGANDDAAGTTAVIMLAKYFKALGNNERTIIFAAFAAEEIGGFGSQYFSKQFDPAKVKAMFNIEMIGTESKWGRNSAYITGYEKTDMGKILQSNLKGTGFTFYPDPYTDQQLFYRSDNATLAALGVPAHTISTSKMDNEPNYHQLSDHVETLDMANMAMIIKSIALSSATIIAGKDTPSRVNVSDLK
ncbi:MAG: M20/M25/M40 family metallo-hydrolase [Bacteroidota bacterium]